MTKKDEINKLAREEESRCIKQLSDFVQERIVPVDPVHVVGKLANIADAIIWYIDKLEAENKTARKPISSEDYDELIAMPPEKRVRESSGDTLYDKIVGILIAYSKIYDMRNGWIDIITVRDAEKEIKQLIKDSK